MNKRKQILLQYKKGERVCELTKKFHLSRQRVYQIVGNYHQTISDKTKATVLHRDRFTCQLGIHCDAKSQLNIHHFDNNPQNNSLDNLFTLCTKCHRFVHFLEKTDEVLYPHYKKRYCPNCKQYLSKDKFTIAGSLCIECHKKIDKEKTLYWSYKYKLTACKKCSQSEDKHYLHGMCQKCFNHYLKICKKKNGVKAISKSKAE